MSDENKEKKWYRVKFTERRRLYYRVYTTDAETAQDKAAEMCDDGIEPFDVLDSDKTNFSCDEE